MNTVTGTFNSLGNMGSQMPQNPFQGYGQQMNSMAPMNPFSSQGLGQSNFMGQGLNQFQGVQQNTMMGQGFNQLPGTFPNQGLSQFQGVQQNSLMNQGLNQLPGTFPNQGLKQNTQSLVPQNGQQSLYGQQLPSQGLNVAQPSNVLGTSFNQQSSAVMNPNGSLPQFSNQSQPQFSQQLQVGSFVPRQPQQQLANTGIQQPAQNMLSGIYSPNTSTQTVTNLPTQSGNQQYVSPFTGQPSFSTSYGSIVDGPPKANKPLSTLNKDIKHTAKTDQAIEMIKGEVINNSSALHNIRDQINYITQSIAQMKTASTPSTPPLNQGHMPGAVPQHTTGQFINNLNQIPAPKQTSNSTNNINDISHTTQSLANIDKYAQAEVDQEQSQVQYRPQNTAQHKFPWASQNNQYGGIGN